MDQLMEEGGDGRVNGFCFDKGFGIPSLSFFSTLHLAGNTSHPHM